MPSLKQVIINGEPYVPRKHVEEALSIIGGLSELYDNLAANPSEPTAEEKREERKLGVRWTRLLKRLWGV